MEPGPAGSRSAGVGVWGLVGASLLPFSGAQPSWALRQVFGARRETQRSHHQSCLFVRPGARALPLCRICFWDSVYPPPAACALILVPCQYPASVLPGLPVLATINRSHCFVEGQFCRKLPPQNAQNAGIDHFLSKIIRPEAAIPPCKQALPVPPTRGGRFAAGANGAA